MQQTVYWGRDRGSVGDFAREGGLCRFQTNFHVSSPGFHTPVAPFRYSVPFPPLCLVAGTEGGFHGDRFPIPKELQGEEE